MKNRLRRAILIGAEGTSEDGFLPGVATDLYRIWEFLLSKQGGNWTEGEILFINSANVNEVISALDKVNTESPEYVFVYFAGHGFSDEYSYKRYINLQNGCLFDTDLLLPAVVKQFVFIDACRTFRGSRISGIPEYGDPYLNFIDDTEARDLFNYWILKSPAGKVIYHATSAGKPAYEKDGGIFTKAFLDVATQRKSQLLSPVFLNEILLSVNELIQQRGFNQQPQIVYQTGNLQVPVAIHIPVSENKVSELIPVYRFQRNAPTRFSLEPVSPDWNTVAAFSLLLLAGSLLLTE